MFGLARHLTNSGVLGINRRNNEFVMRYNERRRYPLVDDKLRTKELAIEAGIAVPELYGVVRAQSEVRNWPGFVEGRGQFVVKPAHGSGGDGIIVISGSRDGRYRRSSGLWMRRGEIDYHISGIVSGQYSLAGLSDCALIEYCVQSDPVFEMISYQGVPDVRIIVLLGHPVMAMVRLPTRQSNGKANLHQGAIGVGVDLSTGKTTGGVWGNDLASEHPDTAHPIANVQIPQWRFMLELAARGYELSGLGYLGVDIVLDRDKGPLVLELNARPGLNIQIANRSGLRERLLCIEHNGDPSAPPSERVDRALELLGG